MWLNCQWDILSKLFSILSVCLCWNQNSLLDGHFNLWLVGDGLLFLLRFLMLEIIPFYARSLVRMNRPGLVVTLCQLIRWSCGQKMVRVSYINYQPGTQQWKHCLFGFLKWTRGKFWINTVYLWLVLCYKIIWKLWKLLFHERTWKCLSPRYGTSKQGSVNNSQGCPTVFKYFDMSFTS